MYIAIKIPTGINAILDLFATLMASSLKTKYKICFAIKDKRENKATQTNTTETRSKSPPFTISIISKDNPIVIKKHRT